MPRRKRRQTPLVPLPLAQPGQFGLNTELARDAIDPRWSLLLQNWTWDRKGKLTLRNGYVDQTGTPIANDPEVHVLAEYIQVDDTRTLVAATRRGANTTELWESDDDGDTWTEITGSLSSDRADGTFVTLNGKLYYTDAGQKIWEYDGSGTFTEIAASPVTNGVLLAAYGRLWAVEDGTLIVQYCALLDPSDWSGTGAGSLDPSNVFTKGTEAVTGLAAFGATLVIGAQNQLILYVDGAGSEVGVSPDNLYVADTIEGTGFLEKDAILNIGDGDLWYLSEAGIESLVRVVQENQQGQSRNEKTQVSSNIESLVQELITAETGTANTVKAVFDASRELALFNFKGSDKVLCFDTRQALPDGTYRACEWTDQPFYSMCRRKNGDLLFGLDSGNVALYTGYRDAGSTAFDGVWSSPWLDGGAETHNRKKIPKDIYVRLSGRDTLTATLRWGFDFRPLEFSTAFTSEYISSGGEWGVAEFGSAEFSEGHRDRFERVGAGGEGQFMQVYLTVESTDVDTFLTLQEIGIYTRLGNFV